MPTLHENSSTKSIEIDKFLNGEFWIQYFFSIRCKSKQIAAIKIFLKWKCHAIQLKMTNQTKAFLWILPFIFQLTDLMVH